MYALKRLIDALVSPLALAALLFIAALVFRGINRRRVAAMLAGFSVGVGYLGSTPLAGTLLLAPLESRFSLPSDRELAGVQYVVVLGSSYRPLPGRSSTSALDEEGLRRVVEGVRLHRRLAGSTLIFSGGSPVGGDAPATGGARLALELGVDGRSILTLKAALDTREEARDIARMLGNQRFVLVTSAAHMPRAFEYLRRAGALPIAAPTGQRADGGIHWALLVPSSRGLRMTEIALHEYLGLLAQRFG